MEKQTHIVPETFRKRPTEIKLPQITGFPEKPGIILGQGLTVL